MILDILKYPDPRLRVKSLPIETITEDLKRLSNDMLETMYHSKGVGLAAPQIGKALRLIVIDPAAADLERHPAIYINPIIELIGTSIVSEREGCLSVPLDFRADVMRSDKIHLKALGIDGRQIDEIVEGFPAIIIQHEVDHLEGQLFVDKISHLRRTLYDNKVKKWMKQKQAE